MTGAGRGLGREMSYQLAKEGAKVVCVDINAEGVKETADVINGGRTGADAGADFYTTNVAEPSQVNELAKAVEEKWGKVDVLINNAGIVASAPLMDTTDEQIKRMIDVNLVSHFWVSVATILILSYKYSEQPSATINHFTKTYSPLKYSNFKSLHPYTSR